MVGSEYLEAVSRYLELDLFSFAGLGLKSGLPGVEIQAWRHDRKKTEYDELMCCRP